MDWNEPWAEQPPPEEIRERSKWNYVFLESLKMAVLLPLIILMIEYFLPYDRPGSDSRIYALISDYFFMFSVIFLIFVVYHLVYWNRTRK